MSDLMKMKLTDLVRSGVLSPEAMIAVLEIVQESIVADDALKIANLEEMIIEWETSMGEDDKTFYSLGIRRAIDILTGESALKQLPVLEKPDTPDEM